MPSSLWPFEFSIRSFAFSIRSFASQAVLPPSSELLGYPILALSSHRAHSEASKSSGLQVEQLRAFYRILSSASSAAKSSRLPQSLSLLFEPPLCPIPFCSRLRSRQSFGDSTFDCSRLRPFDSRASTHIPHPFTHYPAGAESLRPHFAPFTSGRTSRHLCLVFPRGCILLQCLGGSLAYHRLQSSGI